MSGIEILGIAASVIQIADAGARLSSKLFIFTRKVKNADRTISEISQEIAATGAALRELGEALGEDKFARLGSQHSINTTSQIVADCWKVFTDINDTIGGDTIIKDGSSDSCNTSSSKTLARFSKPSFSLKQRLKFPYIEPQIMLLKSKLEGLKSSLMLMLQVLILAEQVRNRPHVPVTEDQKALIETLIEERNAKENQFRASCLALENKNGPTSTPLGGKPGLEQVAPDSTTVSTSSLTSIPNAPVSIFSETLQNCPETPRAILCTMATTVPTDMPQASRASRPLPRQLSSVTETDTASTGSIAVTSKLTPTTSLETSTDVVSNDVPAILRIRQEEIQHHAQLVHNLLEEISDVQYRIDHGIRHRMHDGVLKIHWDEWVPYAERHGHDHFLDTFERRNYDHMSRYGVDQRHGYKTHLDTNITGSKDQERNHKSEKPILKFVDAIGRSFNLPFDSCRMWTDMEAVIVETFAHIDELCSYVTEGRYDLVGPDGSIILPRFWETTVEPETEVKMLLWPLTDQAIASPPLHSRTRSQASMSSSGSDMSGAARRETKREKVVVEQRDRRSIAPLTEEQVLEVREVFSLLDKQGDGKILPQDLQGLMRSLGQNPTDAELRAIMCETTNEEFINFDGFLNLMTRQMQDLDLELEPPEAFKVFDRDQNSFVSVEELRIYAKNMEQGLTDTLMEEIILEAEKDGNGKVNLNDFVRRAMSYTPGAEDPKLTSPELDAVPTHAVEENKSQQSQESHGELASMPEAALEEVARAIGREKALVAAAKKMRATTDNAVVVARLDAQVRDHEQKVTELEEELYNLHSRKLVDEELSEHTIVQDTGHVLVPSSDNEIYIKREPMLRGGSMRTPPLRHIDWHPSQPVAKCAAEPVQGAEQLPQAASETKQPFDMSSSIRMSSLVKVLDETQNPDGGAHQAPLVVSAPSASLPKTDDGHSYSDASDTNPDQTENASELDPQQISKETELKQQRIAAASERVRVKRKQREMGSQRHSQEVGSGNDLAKSHSPDDDAYREYCSIMSDEKLRKEEERQLKRVVASHNALSVGLAPFTLGMSIAGTNAAAVKSRGALRKLEILREEARRRRPDLTLRSRDEYGGLILSPVPGPLSDSIPDHGAVEGRYPTRSRTAIDATLTDASAPGDEQNVPVTRESDAALSTEARTAEFPSDKSRVEAVEQDFEINAEGDDLFRVVLSKYTTLSEAEVDGLMFE